jgi:hypothetical protein
MVFFLLNCVFEKEAIKKSPSLPRIWDERLGSAVPPMLTAQLLTQKTDDQLSSQSSAI